MKRNVILTCDQKPYMSQINLQHGTTTDGGEQEEWKTKEYKKLSYRRGTARCVVSIVILPIATQQCRNYLYDKS